MSIIEKNWMKQAEKLAAKFGGAVHSMTASDMNTNKRIATMARDINNGTSAYNAYAFQNDKAGRR